jgi:hypothetical protein
LQIASAIFAQSVNLLNGLGILHGRLFSHGRSGDELTRPTLAALTSDEKCNCNGRSLLLATDQN